MFTKVVKLVEEPESFVTASVRLYSLDEFYGVRMNQMFYSVQSGFGTGFIFCEGEVNRSEGILGRTGVVCNYELISEVIKSANEVPDDISSGTQCIEGNMINVVGTRRMFEGLDLAFSARGIAVKHIERDFHISQVLFGPLDLGIDQSQSGRRS